MFKSIGEAASGMPKRPTRRGGRNKIQSNSAGVPSDHLKNLTNALNANEHGKAKNHAFALIRSLPKAQLGVALPNDLPDAKGPPDSASSGADDGPSPAAKVSGMPSRLAMAMRGKGKPMPARLPQGTQQG